MQGSFQIYTDSHKGHSLSVSDIVVLRENGKNSAHFVDSFGFTRLPEFMRALEGVKEQDTQKAESEERQETSGHDVQKPEQTEPEEPAETELAFQIADCYISIQETEGGYDYSIMGLDYKEIEGGVYDNPGIGIEEAINEIVEDLKIIPFDNGARGNIRDGDKLINS